MNRKLMDGLSYGFYFVVICLLILVVYLIFFKKDTPKIDKTDNNSNNEQHEDVKNENIRLNRESISLDIGGSFDLVTTITPSDGTEKVIYTSSDDNIVSVDENGRIYAVSAGMATITVKVEGTDLSTICQVNVSENIIDVDNIFVPETKISMKQGEAYQLDVTVTPINAVDKSVVFSSNNEEFVKVDENGLITAIKSGVTRVYVTSVSNPDVSLEIMVNVK